jgi:DNA-directed RNA polymerase subunit H (RpoH/RPB5)
MKYKDSTQLMIHRGLIALIAGIAAIGWVLVWRQSQFNQQFASRLERQILDDVNYRLETEDAIKQRSESKRKAQEFLLQQDTLKEVEGAISVRMDKAQLAQQEAVFSLQSELVKQNTAVRAEIDELEKLLAQYKIEQDAFKRQQLADIVQLDKALLGELVKLSQMLKANALDIEAGAQEITNLKRDILLYRKSSRESSQKLEFYQKQLQALKNELQLLQVPAQAGKSTP